MTSNIVVDIEHLSEIRGDAIIEFYAPWCSHCKRFKPEYAAVAETAPDVLANLEFARVNCDTVPCEEYGVTQYPTLVRFSELSYEWSVYDGRFTRTDVIEWLSSAVPGDVSQWLPQALAHDGEEHEELGSGAVPEWRAHKVASADDYISAVDRAFSLLSTQCSAKDGLVMTVSMTTAVKQVLITAQYLDSRFRSISIRVSSYTRIPCNRWLTVQSKFGLEPLERTIFCGTSVPCMSWVMLHATAAIAEDPVAGVKAVVTLLIGTFPCADCVKHLNQTASAGQGSMIPALPAVASRQGAALWAWRVHNEVNSRLGKAAFPEPTECMSCGSTTEILNYLETVYMLTPKQSLMRFYPTAVLAGPLIVAGRAGLLNMQR